MFRAIGRLFRAFIYLITGRIDEARKTIMQNPNVIQANYDEIISTKIGRLSTLKNATGGLITQQENKFEKLKQHGNEIQKLEQMRAGAAAKAKELVAAYNGGEGVKNDPKYIECQSAFRDFSSTLTEKQKMVAELEKDVKSLGSTIQTYKSQITVLLREVDRLKSEKHEAVAEIISAKEEKEIADMLSGISEDRSNKELQELRDIRTNARASARISREVAGVSARQTEDEFLSYGQNNAADSEFDKLVGLAAPDVKVIEMKAESINVSPKTEKVEETL